MTLRRYRELIAFQTDDGSVWGFHSRNLEVAKLDKRAWDAMQQAAQPRPPDVTISEVQGELDLWNDSPNDTTVDQAPSRFVQSLTINITQICNLHCTYCAAGGDGTYGSDKRLIDVNKVIPQIRWFLNQVPPGESFSINFLGGEPLLYPQAIRLIVDHAQQVASEKDIQLQFLMTTNGTLVTPQIAEMLALINCHVVVSIDGDLSVQDALRPSRSGAGSFEKVVKGLRELEKVKSRLGSLATNSVFGAHNVQVMATYQFLQQFELDRINFIYAAGSKDAEVNQDYIEQVCAVADEAFRLGGEGKLRQIAEFDRYFRVLDSQTRISNHCSAGKSLLQIDTKGDVYACNWFMNNPKDKLGSGTDLKREEIQKYQSSLIELNNCHTCWARFVCGGGCMFVNETTSGHKHQKDRHFCQRTRSFIAKGVEYYGKVRQGSDTRESNGGETREVY